MVHVLSLLVIHWRPIPFITKAMWEECDMALDQKTRGYCCCVIIVLSAVICILIHQDQALTAARYAGMLLFLAGLKTCSSGFC